MSHRRYPRRVTAFRRLLAARSTALLICAAALLLKLVVPTGYMIGMTPGGPAIMPCSGVVEAPAAMAEMPRMLPDHDGGHHGKDHGRAEAPCAFAGLSAATLGAIDPIQLAALIAFVVAIALLPRTLRAPARRAHLRPPLRGPPATS